MKTLLAKDWRRRGLGAAATTVGFLLSPLSWWNDLFVNVPLALAFAWTFSWIWPEAFGGLFVVGYWLTNVLGLVLMHRGGAVAAGLAVPAYGARQLIKDLLIGLLYTALILLLVKFRILAPLPDYFGKA